MNSKYNGPLDSDSNTPAIVKKAYESWCGQNRRCNNSNSKSYPWYGAKGIRVEYSSRAFVDWYLVEFEKKKWADPTVGRIDHDDNYKFGNIEMQERGDNCRESVFRTGFEKRRKRSKQVAVYNRTTGKLVSVCKSRTEAEALTGVDRRNIWVIIKKNSLGIENGSRSGFTFRYINEL